MEEKIVIPERLLDHQQLEAVPAYDALGVFEPVGGVGVATQQDLRPARTHALRISSSQPGLHFSLMRW